MHNPAFSFATEHSDLFDRGGPAVSVRSGVDGVCSALVDGIHLETIPEADIGSRVDAPSFELGVRGFTTIQKSSNALTAAARALNRSGEGFFFDWDGAALWRSTRKSLPDIGVP